MFVIFRNYVRANKVNDVSVIIREPDLQINEIFRNDEKAEFTKTLLVGVTEYLHSPYKLQDFQSASRTAKAIYRCTGSVMYIEQALVTFINNQSADGLIPEYAPSLKKSYNSEDTLDLINEVNNYYNISKDNKFLIKVYNKLLTAWNWFLSFENDKCLLENVKYNDEHRLDLMLNLKYYRALNALKNIASVLGEKDTYIMILRKLVKLKNNLFKLFYNKKDCYFNRYIDDECSEYISKNANAVALDVLFDKKNKKARNIILKVFADENDNVHPLSSYYIGELNNALKKQNMETLIEKELSGRKDYIANSYFI